MQGLCTLAVVKERAKLQKIKQFTTNSASQSISKSCKRTSKVTKN